MLHIYTGEGKGKTTASVGLAIRAHGAGRKVVFLQFLKGRETAEVAVLKKVGIKVLRNSRDYGFFPRTTDENRKAVLGENLENLKTAVALVENGECDFLILDEVISAYNLEALDRAVVDGLLEIRREDFELVFTGREPPAHFIEAADYISEIKKVKHPYDAGIVARRGVEF